MATQTRLRRTKHRLERDRTQDPDNLTSGLTYAPGGRILKSRNSALAPRKCAECSATFQPITSKGKYCSKECSAEFHARESKEKRALATRNPAAAWKYLSENSEPEGAMGCWLWTGGLNSNGYPSDRVLPHRIAAELNTGKPLGSQPAHHKCGVPACVNPDHLVPVTHAENIGEMLARKYFVSRVRELENALRELNEDHPLLKEIGVPEYDNLVNRKK